MPGDIDGFTSKARRQQRDRDRDAPALANRNVTIRVGRRKVAAGVQRANDTSVIRAVNARMHNKYGEHWPKNAQSFVQLTRRHTTLRPIPQ